MRRVMAAVVLVTLLAATGCSAGTSKTGPAASAPVVLGTSAAMGGSASESSASAGGIAANSIPKGAFASVPGSSSISVAKGQAAISRTQAVEVARAALGSSAAGADLVSAVYVTLPAKFLDAVISDSKPATAPRTAWVVTYTNVTQRRQGTTPGTGEATSTEKAHLGNASVVIDSATGEQLLVDEYPAPQ